MVVRFNLERDCVAITDVDDAGIFAGTLQHPRRFCRQLLQQRLGILVATVFGPERTEDTQLCVSRLTAENVEDAFVFFFAQTMLGNQLGRDLRLVSTNWHQRAPNVTSGAFDATSDSNNPSPSVEPRMSSTERSGCGIKPITLPPSLMMPAMLCIAPFGFASSVSTPSASTYRNTTRLS